MVLLSDCLNNLHKHITTIKAEGKYIKVTFNEYETFYTYTITDKALEIPRLYTEEIPINLPQNLVNYLNPITGNPGVSQFVLLQNKKISYRAPEVIAPSFCSTGFIIKTQ